MTLQKLFIAIALIINGTAFAQHQDLPEKPDLWKGNQKQTADTNNILYAFKKGTTHGHFRYFFMATDNKSGLADYYANALGGGIKFETARFYGFQFGVSGFFIFNIGASDLSQADPKTNQKNRYEIGLFDITDPANKNNNDRLEELYLKYSWRKSHITIGKQLLNTSFINLQDGRMRPTEVAGVYADMVPNNKTKISGGYFYQVSPRSTVEWFSVAQSIGINPQGINENGVANDYAENLKSKGIVMLNVERKLNQNFTAKLCNLFVDNIFNTVLLQSDYEKAVKSNGKIIAAAQLIKQDVVNNGGNADPTKTYFSQQNKPLTFGFKFGWQNKKWQTSINYNRITKSGQYLMPREWGREPFFTFLPRERNEGLGNVNAYVIKTAYTFEPQNIKLQYGIGYYNLPSVKNFKLNKYGTPSYLQQYLDIRYEFTKLLKGFEAQLLIVNKINQGNDYNDYKYVINKVDLWNWNIVINYHF